LSEQRLEEVGEAEVCFLVGGASGWLMLAAVVKVIRMEAINPGRRLT
jgi:hypothetical protein